MDSDSVQVSVQVPTKLMDKAARYHIDLSEATQYGIEHLAQNQLNVVGQNIGLSSLGWGFLGCIPAVLILFIFQPVGYWLLADMLVLIVGMLGGLSWGCVITGSDITISIRNSHREQSVLLSLVPLRPEALMLHKGQEFVHVCAILIWATLPEIAYA